MADARRKASLGDQPELSEVITLKIKVVPGASRNREVGRQGHAIIDLIKRRLATAAAHYAEHRDAFENT